MCGLVDKPTSAQLAGFDSGRKGSGTTIVGYTDGGTAAFNGFTTAGNKYSTGGSFQLSDGTSRDSATLIAQNQKNTTGQAVPVAGLADPAVKQSFVGKELAAAQDQNKDPGLTKLVQKREGGAESLGQAVAAPQGGYGSAPPPVTPLVQNPLAPQGRVVTKIVKRRRGRGTIVGSGAGRGLVSA